MSFFSPRKRRYGTRRASGLFQGAAQCTQPRTYCQHTKIAKRLARTDMALLMNGVPDACGLIVGDDGSNTLQGTAGPDLIYGLIPMVRKATSRRSRRPGLRADLLVRCLRPRRPAIRAGFSLSSKPAAIRLDINTGQLLATPFLNVAVDSSGERGLLGLAFHPDYATNGFFYIYRTVDGVPHITWWNAITFPPIPMSLIRQHSHHSIWAICRRTIIMPAGSASDLTTTSISPPARTTSRRTRRP